MTPQKILWIGQPLESTTAFHSEVGHDYQIEYASLSFSGESIDLLGQPMAIVIRPKTIQQQALWLVRHLYRLRPDLPIIVLAQNPAVNDVIEAYRSGVAEFIQEPIDLEGLFNQIQRLIQEKVTPKVNKISSLLQEIGKKIMAAFYNAQNAYLVPQEFLWKSNEEEQPAPVMRVQFFGEFHLSINGKAKPCKLTKREKNLLAYLLFNHHKPIHRDRLIERFWADTLGDCARNSLHVAIFNIRRWLESVEPSYQYILFRNNLYNFDPQVNIVSDVAWFLKYFQEAWNDESQSDVESALHAYHRAFGFYRDSFLMEFDNEDWILHERSHLEEKFMLVLKKLGDYFLEYKQLDFSIRLFEKILEIDPCYEQAHQGLIQSYHLKNRNSQAIRQFQKCEAALSKMLGVKPSAETLHLYRQINEQGRTAQA